MTYLFDSDWVADWLAGRDDAVRLLSALRPDGLAISLVTYGETYEGIYSSRDPRKSEAVFRQFLRGVTLVSLTRAMMNVMTTY